MGTLSWSAISLTADVSGVLPVVSGGTANSTPYTAGSVMYFNGSYITQDNSNLFYNDSTKRLGIGNTVPNFPLDVSGIIGGGTHRSTLANSIDLSSSNTNSTIDLNYSTGGMLSTSAKNAFGTGDILIQAAPATTSGFGILDANNSAGLIIGTGGNTAPVIFNVNHVEKGRFDSNGYFGLNGSPTSRLHVLGTTTSDIGRFDIGIDFNPVAKPAGGTATLIASSGSVNNGTHHYYITYVTALGETDLAPTTPAYVTTDGSHGQVTVGLPLSSDYRVTGRKIYRTKANQSYWYDVELVTTIPDNSTTSYVDNFPDAGLTNVGAFVFTRDNTTTRSISVGGVQAMLLSSQNTFLGLDAGKNVLSGVSTSGENTFIGNKSGQSITGGAKNIALGAFSFYGGNSTDCVMIGHGVGSNSSGENGSIFIGRNTGFWQTGGYGNIFIGGGAGYGTTYHATNYNTGVGVSALNGLSTGTGNTSFGIASGILVTSGNYNTFSGYYAGHNVTSGSYNIILGASVDAPSATSTGQLNIGNVLYGINLYSSSTSSSAPIGSGKIGIGLTCENWTRDISESINPIS